MAAFPRKQISDFLEIAANSPDANARGTALEDAACAMLGSIPGIFPPRRNVTDFAQAGEIDLLFPHRAEKNGLWFMPVAILCECKNWGAPAGSQQVRVFIDRLKERACTAGILISKGGITGDADDLSSAQRHIARALENGIHVLVLDWDDLIGVRSKTGLIQLLLDKWTFLKSFLSSV